MRGDRLTVSFTVKNTGARAGSEIEQVYAGLPSSTGEPPKRLVGWSKARLAPGESRELSVTVESLFLSIWDAKEHRWRLPSGDYNIMVGGSSASLPLQETVSIAK